MVSYPVKFRFIVLSVLLTLLPSCKHGGGRVLEIAYVSGVQVNLRNRVAQSFEKAGEVKNGDRVEVLDHDRHFAKVRTATGQMGWMEQRYLVSQQVFDRLQKLTAEDANDPIQATGVTRNDTNLHVEPGRETEHLYQISTGEKLSILRRGTAEKGAGAVRSPSPAQKLPPKPADSSSTTRGIKPNDKPSEKNTAPETPANPRLAGPPPVIEDWWLVRDSHGRVGWVLARMVDMDVPLDVAQYAEGQRIVAFFVLNEVQDGDKKVPQYLMVVTEPKDGLPFDFNQLRVFTWNVKKHRYETAYRERLEGMLPVTLAKEDFGKEGVLPVFVVRALQEDGSLTERKYKLNTPIVRRVVAPDEEPAKLLRKAPRKPSSKKRRAR